MILKLNSKSNAVKELQKRLNSLGFIISKTGPGSPGNETENFGKLTEEAVKKFQKSNGLKDDGVVGPKTWGVILSNDKILIKPLYSEVTKEDFSDPEDEMKLVTVSENVPTCPNISELINLINKSNITRKVTRLVFHCTATGQSATVASIQKYWRETLKWKSPGYHIIVKPDGSWTQLADFNNTTNGVAGINSNTIHISYIGGIDSRGKASDNRTEAQTEILETVWRCFSNKMPNLTFHGHYEFSKKSCPSYNVKNWIDSIEK
jgi:N-acetylmuramoyl-L-alanine amidase